MPTPSPDTPDHTLAAYVTHRLDQGKTPQEVRAQLLEAGHAPARVEALLARAGVIVDDGPPSAWGPEDAVRRRNMGIGFGLLVAGIALAFLSVVLRELLPPALGRGMNGLGWGAVVVGMVFFFLGIAQSPDRP
jgi:predicted cobalt transporter CbtA